MANKFLPFIVDTSKPMHIFKTMLSRSKGMNQLLLASSFHLVLTTELIVLRNAVKPMEDMPLEKVYEELLVSFPAARIKEEDINLFVSMSSHFPKESWDEELNQFEMKDIMLFFLAMTYADKPLEAYTSIPFMDLLNRDKRDSVFNDLGAYITFCDEGEKVFFKNEQSLQSFILYEALIKDVTEPDAPTQVYCFSFKNDGQNND